MKQVRPYDTPAYRAARKRLLARKPKCWWHGCPNAATEADHDPPVSFHRHVEHDYRSGGGCCRLRPACAFHQRQQGGLIRAGLLDGGAVGEEFDEVDDGVELVEPESGFDVDDPVWRVAWLDDLRDVPGDATWPRFMSAPHPRAVGSLGVEFEWWCRTHRGTALRWWQRLVARRLLEVDVDGRLVWGTLILTLARQLGKSLLLWLILSWRLHQGDRFGTRQLLLHQSIAKGQAASVLAREVPFAARRPDLYDVEVGKSKQGDVSIEWRADGSAWLVISTGTARSGGAYGWSSVSAAAVDEAWAIPASVVDDGTEPTLLESVDPWLALVSTAHRNATSLMIARRHLAIEDLASVDGQALLLDWSAGPRFAIDDPAGWRQASPHWTPGREQRIRGAVQRAMLGIASDEDDGMSPLDAVNAQYLNRWPTGRITASRTELLLPSGVWASCGSVPEDRVVHRLWVAVETNYGAGAAVAAVALLGDDRFEVDAWPCATVDEAVESADRLAASFEDVPVERVEGAAIVSRRRCTRAGTAETRTGLGLLRELVAAGRVVHDETPDLDGQLAEARVREVAGGLSLVQVAGKPTHLVRAVVWAVRAAALRAPEPAIH